MSVWLYFIHIYVYCTTIQFIQCLFICFIYTTDTTRDFVSYLLVFTYFYIYLYDAHTPVSAYVEIKFLEMCKHTLSMYPDYDNVLMM